MSDAAAPPPSDGPAASLSIALPGGSLSTFAFDDWTLRHLAVALNTHVEWARANAMAMPPRLRDLAQRTTQAASHRHQPTTLDHPAPAREDAAMKPIPHVLTYEDVAEVLSVSVRTVERIVDQGDLQTIRIGTKPRVRREALFAYLDGLAEDAA